MTVDSEKKTIIADDCPEQSDINAVLQTEMTEAEKIEYFARLILKEHLNAFKELAKRLVYSQKRKSVAAIKRQ